MPKNALKLIVPAIILTGLPLVGVIFSGYDIHHYLEFPPKTRYVAHAPFSLPVFSGLCLFILSATLPFIYRAAVSIRARSNPRIKSVVSFPWWGYAGLAAGILFWILAWTRFSWFRCIQPFTFIPQWLSFIVVANALSKKRKGDCLMTGHPRMFLCLFPVSALFWWFFEYLNRFVQNWYYVEVSNLSPHGYFLLASASFSTVLPAVLSTREYLLSFPFFERAFGNYLKLDSGSGRLPAYSFFILSSLGLACIGLFPNYLFPLLWVSPLVLIVSLQSLMNEKHIFSDLSEGKWATVVASAASALICGVFWEMWNYFSLAKWVYCIPYVQGLHLFEMPLLGYAGYLPFGLECAVVADIIK